MSERESVTVGEWTVEELFGPNDDGPALYDCKHTNGVLSVVLNQYDLRDLMVCALNILGVERIEPVE